MSESVLGDLSERASLMVMRLHGMGEKDAAKAVADCLLEIERLRDALAKAAAGQCGSCRAYDEFGLNEYAPAKDTSAALDDLAAEAIDAYQERDEIEAGKMQSASRRRSDHAVDAIIAACVADGGIYDTE